MKLKKVAIPYVPVAMIIMLASRHDNKKEIGILEMENGEFIQGSETKSYNSDSAPNFLE